MPTYEVWGQPPRGEAKILDSADNLPDANRYATEYRMAFGPTWFIWVKKPRKEFGNGTA